MMVRLIPVGRLYESEDKAREAVKKIVDAGYSESYTSVHAQAAASEEDTARQIITQHEAGDVPPNHAALYAKRVHEGSVLVLTTAPFSHGSYITGLMDDAGPMKPEPMPLPPSRIDSPSPLSDFIGWPVLLQNSPTPLSTKLGWSTLSRGLSRFSRWFGGPLTRPGWTFSEKIGMGLSSKNPTPLSSLFGLPLLSKNPTPLSSKFGWRVLSESPTPLSDSIGKSTSTDEQDSRESSFGLPLLIDNPTPLSSKLGLPVLLRKR